jgi:GNAT superfamily N-acetyltransferase
LSMLTKIIAPDERLALQRTDNKNAIQHFGHLIKKGSKTIIPDSIILPFDSKNEMLLKYQEAITELNALIRFTDRPVGFDLYLGNFREKTTYSSIAIVDKKVQGFLFAYEIKGCDYVYLSRTAVYPGEQRKWYFGQMLKIVKDQARSRGLAAIELQTLAGKDNASVIKTYESWGFRAEKIVCRWLQKGVVFKVRMALHLDEIPLKDYRYERAYQFHSFPKSIDEKIPSCSQHDVNINLDIEIEESPYGPK